METDFLTQIDRTEVLTFDCYGTLIDWRAGLESSLLEIFGNAASGRISDLYHGYLATEKVVEAERFRPYREVLAVTVQRLGATFGIDLTDRAAGRLPELLPSWPPFSDTVAALKRLKSRFRLGVLSNIDRDLFSRTEERLDVRFDFVVTAQEVGAYKPSHGHFLRMMDHHAVPERVIHVAQSQYHDGRPARELDLAFVWINRYNDATDDETNPLAVFPTLADFAEAAGT